MLLIDDEADYASVNTKKAKIKNKPHAMTFVTAQGLCFHILFVPVWAVYVPQWRGSMTLKEFVTFAVNGSVKG
jgi:hypothetical protein